MTNQDNPSPLTSEEAKKAWDAVCKIYQTVGKRQGSVDANHALALAEIQTGLPLTRLDIMTPGT